MLLRPAALLASAIGAATVSDLDVRRHWVVVSLFIATLLLTALHLIPLPFSVWSELPGRSAIVAIDATIGFGPIERPLTMSPDATLNALCSLSIPLAVLLLAIQLDEDGHRKILLLLLVLALTSAFFGLLQAAGSDISFYPLQTETSGLFANRNHQAALLAMTLPIAVGAALTGVRGGRSQQLRALVAIALGMFVVPLVLVTGSRAGLVLLGVGLLFSGLLWLWGRSNRPNGWSANAIVPVLFTGLIAGLFAITATAARDVAIDRLSADGEDLRWPVWQSILEMLPAYMPWGTGIGSYAEAYQMLEPEALLRPTFSNHAHNEVLEVALTAGVPGLILLALASLSIVVGLARAFSANAPSSTSATLGRLGLSMIVVLVIASATDYPIRTPIMSAILVIAAVWATMTNGPRSAMGKPQNRS
jgi:O-antigen ligase